MKSLLFFPALMAITTVILYPPTEKQLVKKNTQAADIAQIDKESYEKENVRTNKQLAKSNTSMSKKTNNMKRKKNS